MKRTRIHILVRAIFLASVITGLYAIYTSQQCIKHCTIVIDALCDPTLGHDIMTFARAHMVLSPHVLSALLHNTYPHIATVSFTRCPQELIGDIRVAQPWVNVNDTHFVCTDGKLRAKEVFNHALTHALPRVIIDADDIHAQAQSAPFLSWAVTVSSTFLRKYTVTWHSPVEIIVQDPRDTQVHFIVDARTNLTTAFLLQGYRSKQLASEQSKTNKNGWVVDMRFAQQIVLYPGLKGA